MTKCQALAATLAVAANTLFVLSLSPTVKAAEVASITSSTLPDFQISQSATTGPSVTATYITSSEPRIYLVKVGARGFQFEPAELTNVAVGDVVTYEFYPPDHSVARAEFGSACVPYEYFGGDRTGFWSKTQWVETPSDITHWNLTINSTEPIFYYCAAPNSCKGKLMVGGINPNSTQTLDAQIRAAERADFQQASPLASHRPAEMPVAAIVGIVFGGIAFIAFCAAVLFYLARKARVRGRDAPSTENRTFVDPDSHAVPELPPPFSPFSETWTVYEDRSS
ncbi:hypothetical protein PMIN04_010031, partial [Paraphaeosphaeria minitans]